MGVRISDGARRRMVVLLKSGTMSNREIANMFGTSESTVSNVARQNGIKPRRRPWTSEENELLRNEYETLGPKKIASMLGRNQSSVCHHAKDLGLTTRVSAYGMLRRESD